MQAPARGLRGAVRVVFQLENGKNIGHLALVIDEDEDRGIFVEIVTVRGMEPMWIPYEGEGVSWDWLTSLSLVVSYLEDEESDVLTDYGADIIDCDLDKFMLCVKFHNHEPDPDDPDDTGGIEWVSLIEDEWKWTDIERPQKPDLGKALNERTLELTRRAAAKGSEGGRGGHGGGCSGHGGGGRVGGGGGRSGAGGVLSEEHMASMSPLAQLVARLQAACRPLLDTRVVDAVSIKEVCVAAAAVREISAKEGAVALVALLECKVRKEERGLEPARSPDPPTPPARAPRPSLPARPRRPPRAQVLGPILQLLAPGRVPLGCPESDELLTDLGIVLVNASLYTPTRAYLHRLGGVDVAAAALEVPSEDVVNVALALLQNLSLDKDGRSAVMRCRFMELLPSFLLGNRSVPLREKALRIVHHLTAAADHAKVRMARRNPPMPADAAPAPPPHRPTAPPPHRPTAPLSRCWSSTT